MTVRPARPDDLDVLVAHARACARESEGLEPDRATLRAATLAGLKDPRKARYFVAEQNGAPVGSLFVTFEWSDWNNGWYWWIQAAYVRPEHRGTGAFRKLFDAVGAAAQQAGDVHSVRLYVHNENPAQAVYRGLGMTEQSYRIFEKTIP